VPYFRVEAFLGASPAGLGSSAAPAVEGLVTSRTSLWAAVSQEPSSSSSLRLPDLRERAIHAVCHGGSCSAHPVTAPQQPQREKEKGTCMWEKSLRRGRSERGRSESWERRDTVVLGLRELPR